MQFATFYIDNRLYGINVMEVQEVTHAISPTLIRLAPVFVKGLINMRGQIVTAIGLRELLGLGLKDSASMASIVCRVDGSLLSLLVDRIGDVIEVQEENFETTPGTIDPKMRKYMLGVYKTPGAILSVLKVDSLAEELSRANVAAA